MSEKTEVKGLGYGITRACGSLLILRDTVRLSSRYFNFSMGQGLMQRILGATQELGSKSAACPHYSRAVAASSVTV